MSSSRPTHSSTSSSRSRNSARIIAQTTVDAKLHDEFEELGDSFDYTRSVSVHSETSADQTQRRSPKVTAYLQHIQKGRLIQPFGCLLAVDEKTFCVIAYSENAPEMLTMVSHAVPSVGDVPVLGIGTDVRALFTSPSTAALQKALGYSEVSLLNPILVHCKISGKPFYAIIHRVTACLVIDFESVKPYELPMTAAGALQSYKLAAKAIARLQSLPGGSMERLCDTMVREVFELTGYDRVMAYKFHEDDHGEVVAEITKQGLEPYLGLHYPATDIPQAARFLFMKNKVRMICDCRAKPVKVFQDEKLTIDLTFCGSTLRAPHSCHLQDAPLGIVSQTPNIMDLVKCDGAALLYKDKIWQLGTTPTERQIRDIAIWLTDYHMDSTGLSTDSLHDAGYPDALALGDVVCGMAAARITSKDILFWFRSPTTSEIQWGGAKHERSDQDDGRRMHPRSSFKAFLEVVKTRSLPWKDYEMDAIHSLQLILRGAFNKASVDVTGADDKASIDSRINDLRIEGMVELQAVTNEMVRLIETATVPILAVDVKGYINGWNLKIAELTGLSVSQAIGKHMLTLVEDCSSTIVRKMLHLALQGQEEKNIEFQLKTHNSQRDNGPVILVVNACASRDLHENVVGVCFVAQDMTGQKTVMDKFTRIEGDYKAIIENPSPLIPPIFGADEFGWCSEWNPAMTKISGWRRNEVIDKMLLAIKKSKKLAYIRQEIRNPLSGITYSRKILEDSVLNEEQKQLLHTGAECHHQLNKILNDMDLDDIVESYLDLEMVEFDLREVVATAISQVMIASKGKGIRIDYDPSEVFMAESLYGDSLRLQQILADFLSVSVKFSPSGGQLEISASLVKDRLGQHVHLVHLEIRISHSGSGVPEQLLDQMFNNEEDATEEGISLLVCRKLLRLMNGDVRYLKEAGKSSFIISMELASAQESHKASSIF
ncbi:Phytochrome A [Acorus gramineus]|uniref:Phytochrome A n=1 Tax=Acorus gramineus TaxID=55184 RepID=A0AAV9BLL4_ACOGR|nr:Phytochrome A [Acorus gramineus]